MGIVTLFLNGAPQKIKVKIKESRLLKFYQENSTENSAENNLKENSKFNELGNFSRKEKKKSQIQRTFFPDTKFSRNCTKICNTLSFLSLSFSFLLYKIPFSKFYCPSYLLSYLSPPPLGQDMTQGQFLSGV